MSVWPSTRARQVLAALLRIGWEIKREAGTSHKVLSKPGLPNYVFAFHDKEEIGPKMLTRISKHTGLKPEDLGDRSVELHCQSFACHLRYPYIQA